MSTPVGQIHAAFCPPSKEELDTMLTEELMFSQEKAGEYKILCNPEVAVELFGYPDKQEYQGATVYLVSALHPSLMVLIREA